MLGLTGVIKQMYLADIYRTFHPNTKENTFFSAPHRIFYKIDHILGNKASLNGCKTIEITLCILFDQKD